MTQRRKPDIEPTPLHPFPYSAHTHRIPARDVAIKSRLRTIGFVEDDDGVFWCGRAAEFLGFGGVFAEGGFHLFGGWERGGGAVTIAIAIATILEAEGYESHVAVGDADAGTGCADGEVGLVGKGGQVWVEGSEDLLGFGFKFIFFAGDVGDDVVEDVHGGDAGVAGAGDGLGGEDFDGGDGAEAGLEGSEGNYDADYGTVGVAD